MFMKMCRLWDLTQAEVGKAARMSSRVSCAHMNSNTQQPASALPTSDSSKCIDNHENPMFCLAVVGWSRAVFISSGLWQRAGKRMDDQSRPYMTVLHAVTFDRTLAPIDGYGSGETAVEP